MKILNEEPEPIVRADLPAAVAAAVARCMKKKRGERYATLGELAGALRASLRGT